MPLLLQERMTSRNVAWSEVDHGRDQCYRKSSIPGEAPSEQQDEQSMAAHDISSKEIHGFGDRDGNGTH